MMFNPAPIVASMMFARRQRKESRKREEEKRVKEEEHKKQYPFENKIIEGQQIEIYPKYVYKMIECYKEEENGQLNLLESVYKPKKVITDYYVKIEKYTSITFENFCKKFINRGWQIPLKVV